MTAENNHFEKKSLRKISGSKTDWPDLAESCVAFATASGGTIAIGIEDADDTPPLGQLISADLVETVLRRIGELTVNVTCHAQIETTDNGSQYIALRVMRSSSVPSTASGKYYLREGDRNRPIVGDDIMRLARDRSMVAWESLTSAQIPRHQFDGAQVAWFVKNIRASDRVKASVKEKSDKELLDHYGLADGPWLTNLGVLCLGRRQDRAALGTAPVIQFIKYDEREQKLHKIVWDDYSLSPMQLVDAVWTEVPDFRESYELPDGLFRKLIPAYDETVVRELLVNALVHRPYTQRGDIFIKSYPDRLEVVNPGLLPIGVTPATVLHTTARRNDNLARVFHDLKLMDREGSGFDKMYEVLLAQGRDVPHLREGPDRVEVSVGRRILKPEVINLMGKANQSYQLGQRETICLGLLAQAEHLSARDLAAALMLNDVDALRPWLGRLQSLGLVRTVGRTKATQYFIDPDVARHLPTTTTLGRIEAHRLEALICEDLRRYPGSAISEIHSRIGKEIPRTRLKRGLDDLVEAKKLSFRGDRRWRRYTVAS